MIHLMANNKQQPVPYQTQPPVQIPNPYPNYNNNNNNNNNQKRNPSNHGKRQKRDDDWDICWDYLSPKGCNRDTCRWRHDNPQVDQRQIAKRRKRYMDQNRRDRDRSRQRALIGGPNRNRQRKANGNHQSQTWQNMQTMPPHSILHGQPPPPPYFAPPPPPMPPPQQQPHSSQPQQPQSPQDYWAQYYAAYGYVQPLPPVPNEKEAQTDPTAAFGYPAYGAYPYSPYGYPYGAPYGAYGGGMSSAPNKEKAQDKTEDAAAKGIAKESDKEEQADKAVEEEDKAKTVEHEENEDIDMNEKDDINTNELVFNDEDDETQNNDNNNDNDDKNNNDNNNDDDDKKQKEKEEEEDVKEKEKDNEEESALEPSGDAAGIADKASTAIRNDVTLNIEAQTPSNEEVDLNQNELQSTHQGAGKIAIASDVNHEEDEDIKDQNETINHETNKNENKNENENETNESPPRQCPVDCVCDICSYKKAFQSTQTVTGPNAILHPPYHHGKRLPARHPMFDGMEYTNIPNSDSTTTNPWAAWHQKYQRYLQTRGPALPPPNRATNPSKKEDIDMKDAHHQTNQVESFPAANEPLEYNLPNTTSTATKATNSALQCVFTTDPQTGGLVSVPASSVSATTATVAATTLQQQQFQSQQILQKAQQEAICAQQQLQRTMASLAQNNLYFDANTGQYTDLRSGAINTPNPMAPYINPYYQPNANSGVSAQRRSTLQIEQTNANKAKKKKKKKDEKKNQKKGIESCVKWLYIISDAKRECYGSLCRGQFDAITTTKWLTSLYEEAEWGNGVKDRSRGQSDGPAPNHIAWYTLSGCNCSLHGGIQDEESSNVGFPIWLQQIADTIMKICSCDKDPPNCAELFYFENKASRWNWHSYCEHPIFELNADERDNKHKGQTIHLWIGHRKQFKFAPRRTKAVPGDEERSIYLENGDVFVTCGKFTEDYVVKIDSEEDIQSHAHESVSRAHSSMYIVWRWIVNHNAQCLQKDNF